MHTSSAVSPTPGTDHRDPAGRHLSRRAFLTQVSTGAAALGAGAVAAACSPFGGTVDEGGGSGAKGGGSSTIRFITPADV
ncbi:MAG TPA: hypothetical protein VE287_11880, partial [Actinopolymorphaceae bacterium]|nr:hypothetical protein [Actinopolymorphaceae bacterium]